MRTARGRQAAEFLNSHGKSDWYRIRNADSDTATVTLYDEIGLWGTTAADFAEELKGITAANIDVHLQSQGGDVFDGIAIYNALRQHSAKVTTIVDAVAMSIATVIAQAGDERVMVSGSQMMIHNAWGVVIGDAAEFRKAADTFEKQNAVIAGIYAERSGRDAAEFLAMMAEETWLNHDETVEAGLADRVLVPESKQDRNQESNTTDVDAAATRVARIAAMLRQAEEITV